MIETSNIIKIIKGLDKLNRLITATSKEGSKGYLIPKRIIISIATLIKYNMIV